jgi:predicted RNA-binding protein with RPS1 domain
MIHISELADFRVKAVEDVVKMGDIVTAKCIGIDDKGRVKMSRKAAMLHCKCQSILKPIISFVISCALSNRALQL